MEAMSMADKIAVMNHGIIEQFGTPREIYDRPSTMYVADFMGSPPMNFLGFHSGLETGASTVTIRGSEIAVPRIREARAPGDLALGVRPEHIRLDDSSSLRGRVLGAEYLGTTQIVVIETEDGTVKARIPADAHVSVGEQTGLSFTGRFLSLFDKASGRAIDTELRAGAANHG
jgi:multiple sugar transport system ATP-binding protein